MKEICLVGGGHTHALAAKPLSTLMCGRARITLISPEPYTPYSGMMPGTVETVYAEEEFRIDLERLAENCSIRWVKDEVSSIDPKRRTLTTGSGKSLLYDVASLNTGGAMRRVLETGADVMCVKPIEPFLAWLSWLDSYKEGELDVCVVGGGAAGVEIVCAIRERIIRRFGKFPFDCRITLLEAGPTILSGYPEGMARRVGRELAAKGINIYVNSKVVEHKNHRLQTEAGESIDADKVILATPTEASKSMETAKLELNADGFIAVNRYLQSTSHPDVFACGDACGMHGLDFPKAGVFAVRQARTLAHNVAAHCQGSAPLREFPPRKTYLSIINLGSRQAIASYGRWFWKGKWVWLWKHCLDKSFMNKLARA